MKTEYSLKMYTELMAHIVTIENMIISQLGGDPGEYEKTLKFHRENIKKQLKI